MSKVKISLVQSELVRVLNDEQPDALLHVVDQEWGAGQVAAYRWSTLEQRVRTPQPIGDAVAALVRRRFAKFLTVRPSWAQRVIGKRPEEFCYLTPLGFASASDPTLLAEPLARDDYDRRYEPKGLWLRQIEGLPPRTE